MRIVEEMVYNKWFVAIEPATEHMNECVSLLSYGTSSLLKI